MKDNSIFKNSKIFVSGGTGLIGSELIDLLKKYSPKKITSVSLDSSTIDGVECIKADLTNFITCKELISGHDYVFQLMGVKGSPDMTRKNPASFLVPMTLCNTAVLESSRLADVKWILYTSSIGVYSPCSIFREDDVWNSLPSSNDLHAGITKRIAELQLDAYKIQYNWNKFSIIRPANIFGNRDNYNPKTSMVIPGLISRICSGEDPLICWGTGECIRDFCHARDVARAMIFAVVNRINKPINIGSGSGILIKDLVNIVTECYKEITGKNINVKWDTDKPTGDKIRIMDMSRLFGYGYKNIISLKDGIKEAMIFYLENKDIIQKRYDVFNQQGEKI